MVHVLCSHYSKYLQYWPKLDNFTFFSSKEILSTHISSSCPRARKAHNQWERERERGAWIIRMQDGLSVQRRPMVGDPGSTLEEEGWGSLPIEGIT